MLSSLTNLRRPLANESYRAVWMAQIVSVMGDWAARLALAVLVLARTHSPFWAGLVTAASFVPWLGPGQVLATTLDRFKRKRVMIWADLIRAALFGVLVLPLPAPAIILLVFVAATATPAFETARSALLVEIVSKDVYPDTLALASIILPASDERSSALQGGSLTR